ncbi:hypothetical protein Hanom_Chr00s000003g01602811 [Helianthus anomalus]
MRLECALSTNVAAGKPTQPSEGLECAEGLANKKDTSLDPTVKILNGTEVIWQIPDSPRSILFIAHGCNGRAANFWDKSEQLFNWFESHFR